MEIIKNLETLLSHGNVQGRKIALDIIEAGLKASDPYENVRKLIRVKKGDLIVDAEHFDLSKIGDIYVIGAGKAAQRMAKALEDVLGERVTRGVVNVKRGEGKHLKRIKVVEAGHPIPDLEGVRGAEEIVEIAKDAKENDIVFATLSGGVSSLLPLPVEGITLEDKAKTTDLLLKSGADIREINAVRGHLSQVKGGKLAKYVHPAKLLNILTAGNPKMSFRYCTFIPTLPDPSTLEDAVAVLKHRRLWNTVPDSVRTFFEKAGPRFETPKSLNGMFMRNYQVMHNEFALQGAKQRAEELNISSVILSSGMHGEAREVGVALASIAKEIEQYGRPFAPSCAIISGGETTVTVGQATGEGGPNQELILSFARGIAGSKNITVASVDTDGTDGPTDIAGGIADGYTLQRVKEIGIDILQELNNHNSSRVLKRIQDAIITGPTGTNVPNLRVMVVTGQPKYNLKDVLRIMK